MPNSVERPTRVPMIFEERADVDALLDVVGQVEVRVVERVAGRRRGGAWRRVAARAGGRATSDPSRPSPRDGCTESHGSAHERHEAMGSHSRVIRSEVQLEVHVKDVAVGADRHRIRRVPDRASCSRESTRR